MAIRLYLSALTLVFLFLTVMTRGVGLLEAIVVTSALLYLILDAREQLQIVKAEVGLLQRLAEKLSVLSR